MRTRSTGLGRMELVSRLESIKRQGDYLLLTTRSTEPVRWHIRIALSREDMRQMLRAFLNVQVLLYIFSLPFRRKDSGSPGDY